MRTKPRKHGRTTNSRPLQHGSGGQDLAHKHSPRVSHPIEETESHGNRLEVVYFHLIILGMKLSSMNPAEVRHQSVACKRRDETPHEYGKRERHKQGDYMSDETHGHETVL